jgi:glycosyltransferase involved in cell wall biosynthesis
MSLSGICPVIITRDAASTLGATLTALSAFPEVLVYDNGSRDATIEIARSFPNVRVERGEFLGFGPTKQRATDLASSDWVLSIDADERPDKELIEAIDAAPLDNERVAYFLHRANLFMGQRIEHGAWGNDRILRLFNRRQVRFDDAPVHEKLVAPENLECRRLDGLLWHDACTSIDQFLHKISQYSELERRKAGKPHSLLNIWFRSRWAFFRSYILQGGWREGWRGLVIANCLGQGSFFKHMKRYADKRVEEESSASTLGHRTSRWHT